MEKLFFAFFLSVAYVYWDIRRTNKLTNWRNKQNDRKSTN